MTSEREKAELGADSLAAFFSQFGEKSDAEISLLDILLEELMKTNPRDILVGDHAKNVSIPSESEQRGDQTGDGAQERVGGNIQTVEPGIVEIADDMAKPNPENSSREQDAVRTVGGNS